MSLIENKEKYSFLDTVKIIIWLNGLFYKIVPKLILTLFVTQILVSILPFIENRLFSSLIDSLVIYIQSNSNQWITYFFLFFTLLIVATLLTHLQNIILTIVNIQLENNLRKVYISKISSLDYQSHENKDISNLIAKTNEDYMYRSIQVVHDSNQILSSLVSSVTVLIILLPNYWYLAILIILGEIPGFLIDKKWNMLDWILFNNNIEKNSIGWDILWQLTEKKHLAELKIYNSIKFLYKKFTEIFDIYTQKKIQIHLDRSSYQTIYFIFSKFIILVCMLVIIKDIKNNLLTIGMFTFYFSTFRQAGDFFSGLINKFTSLSEHSYYVDSFRKIMLLNNSVRNGNLTQNIGSSPKIEFINVSFKYPNSSVYVFKNLNLTINPNEEIALVGINGAGKSTLIKLICRFYDPTDGQILINGIDLKEFDLTYWHKHISVLFQEFTTYPNLNLKENVLISQTDIDDNSRIFSSLKKSEGYQFSKKYKDGLDTIMSQRYGGEEPSWGQWQKIALARIFFRDTPILILDEPTASIDATSEYRIFSRLYKKTRCKTIIIVSHRFSTVRNAQRIIVIDKGKITEQGSHNDLVSLNGKYAKSFNLQAQGYN